jgi:hypothetical protein
MKKLVEVIVGTVYGFVLYGFYKKHCIAAGGLYIRRHSDRYFSVRSEVFDVIERLVGVYIHGDSMRVEIHRHAYRYVTIRSLRVLFER